VTPPSFTREPRATRGGIPRFVEDTYAETFGEQWSHWRRTQLDSATGLGLSRMRYDETGWPADGLEGELVLEAGAGAGRFTEVLLATGAEIVSVDASTAIDVAVENNPSPRLTALQADLNDLPWEPGQFDRVFCFGVVQHTPDPRATFLALVEQARPGGHVAVDVYRRSDYVTRYSSKYLWRPLTTRMPKPLLRRLVEWYVPKWLPVDTRLARVPKLGRFLTAVVPLWNYTGVWDLSPEQLRAWAVLDTYDALSPAYDRPQTLADVDEWARAAGLVDYEVKPGWNGIVVTGRRPG
jgi:SAM-dependent methyltransferase